MFVRRRVRCADCGFLEATLATSHSPQSMSYGFENNRPATLEERHPNPNAFWSVLREGAVLPLSEGDIISKAPLYACKVTAFNLVDEIPDLPPDVTTSLSIIRRDRDCAYFERFRPLLSFREHLDLKLRRGERWWAACGALAGIVATAAAGIVVRLVTG